jgi:hypothetical protein
MMVMFGPGSGTYCSSSAARARARPASGLRRGAALVRRRSVRPCRSTQTDRRIRRGRRVASSCSAGPSSRTRRPTSGAVLHADARRGRCDPQPLLRLPSDLEGAQLRRRRISSSRTPSPSRRSGTRGRTSSSIAARPLAAVPDEESNRHWFFGALGSLRIALLVSCCVLFCLLFFLQERLPYSFYYVFV